MHARRLGDLHGRVRVPCGEWAAKLEHASKRTAEVLAERAVGSQSPRMEDGDVVHDGGGGVDRGTHVV